MKAHTLVLASKSPRRAALLRQIGLKFDVVDVALDEARLPGEGAAAYVERLATAKARAGHRAGALTVGADTAVVLGRRVLGKPGGPADATRMLLALAGRSHRVMTAVAVYDGRRLRSRNVTTRVRFRAIGRREAEAYARTGEGADKAGGYGIQGIGGIFVEEIRGSYSAVVGLPLVETEALLRSFGFETWRERLHG